MARRLQSQANTAYGTPSGVTPMFPAPIAAWRNPAATDVGYPIGQSWVNQTSGQAYIMTGSVAGAATWALSSPGASDVDTINGLSPVLGNIIIDGGTNITDVNAGNTVTLNLNNAITLATSVTSPIYTSAAGMAIQAPAANNITVRMGDGAGANKVSFTTLAGAEVFSINSLGSIGTLAGLTVTGAFTQTAGNFNVGQDNAANAINIGGGTTARAITIASGAALHTVAIGSASAGAMTIDSAAGISLDAATASNFTVTGAGLDLTLSGVGGAVNVTSTQNENDAIVIEASDAVGGVQIRAGTGGILIGNEADTTAITLGLIAPTSTRNITIGAGTVVTAAVTDTINVGTDGATTNANSVKTVNINTGTVAVGQVLTNIATGAVTSGTHTTSIATGARAAGTMAVDIATGTGTKTVSVGNVDGLTTLNIRGITLLNDSVNVATSINAGTSTGAVTIGNAVSGIINITGGAAVNIDAVGVLELNSSAGVIGIGNDAVAQNINIGTGAAVRVITIGNGSGATSVVVNSGTAAASFAANATVHTTTIGSTTGASATVIQSGTGKITMTGTIQEATTNFMTRTGDSITFYASPIVQSTANTGAAPTGATGDTNIVCCREGVMMEEFVIGAGQTIIAPRMDANGLLVSGDLTVAEGYEYNFGAARTNSRHAFTIGTSPAFFFELRFRINDMDGAAPYVFGFRKVEANNAVFGDYTDYATIGMIAASSATQVVTATELNSGGQTVTNTTDLWGGDGTTNTLTVLVSAAGVVTYLLNGVVPTVVAAFTFDAADVVVPFIRITHSASPTAVNLVSMKIGYQV